MIGSLPRPRCALAGRTMALAVALAAVVGTARAQDSWDAVYLGGAKIGYVHTWVEKVSDKGRDYNRVRIDIEQRLKRRNDEAVIKLMYGTIETLDGEVLRLDTRTQAGETQDLRVHGDVINHQMRLTMDGTGRAETRLIDWGSDVRGPYGPEQSMARKPMKEHEKRSVRMFIPELNKVCDVTLEARTLEPVLLGDGTKRPLLRVDQTTMVDGTRRSEYDARLYVDPEGQVLKSEQDVLGGMVVYRTTKEAAKAPGGPVSFDLISSTVAKVSRKIPNAEQTRHVKYRVMLEGSEIAKILPTDARQVVLGSSLGKDASGKEPVILEIRSVGPLDGEAATAPAGPEYLKPNALVNCDDVRVRTLTQRVTRGMADPWEKAKAINKWVAQNVRDKNFKVAFAAAGEVARNLSGDCTEHSVLTAAMCRAAGIPSRVAIGLIYVDELDGFGYHMWDEVFVNNRWIAIDPSFDQTMVDAVHIKLSDTSLDGVAPFEAFLPVVAVVNKLTIEPMEIR